MSSKTHHTWTGKSKATGFAYSLHYWTLKYTGLTGAYILLIFVAAYFFFFDRQSNRVTRHYFRKIHGFSPLKSFFFIYRLYYVFGQCILDKVAILGGKKDLFDVQFDGREMLMKLAEEGKGCILVSAHIGNWEIAGQYLNNARTPVNIVMYDTEHHEVKEVLSDSLKNRKFNIIPIKEDFSHLMQLKEAIDNREFICMHGDRLARNENLKRSEEVNFFGHPVLIPRGPFELARKYKMPYVFVSANRARGRAYRFKAFRPDPEGQFTPGQMIDAYVDFMEKTLTKYPEQWFNFYDYWGFDHRDKNKPKTEEKLKEISPL